MSSGRGKLVLKGSKGSKKKKSSSSSSSSTSISSVKVSSEVQSVIEKREEKFDTEKILTDAEKRHKKRRLDLEHKTGSLTKLATTTFRERIDSFNNGLSKLTEHNDIPRVSAAGNG